jgi:hypothetical protein
MEVISLTVYDYKSIVYAMLYDTNFVTPDLVTQEKYRIIQTSHTDKKRIYTLRVFLERFHKIAKNHCLLRHSASVLTSVRFPHGTTRLPLDGFS